MSTEATPRPWVLKCYDEYDELRGADSTCIHATDTYYPTAIGRQDLKLIVRAVNRSDALEAVAEVAQVFLNEHYNRTGHKALRDALAKLEECEG